MKTQLKKNSILLFFATGLLLSSCLKDLPNTVDFTKNAPVIEFPTGYGNLGQNRLINPVFNSQSQTFPVDLNLASPSLLGQDVTVSVGIDPQGLSNFMKIQKAAGDSATYILPPAAAYTFGSQVIIHKGTRLDSTLIKITPSMLDTTLHYAIPLYISAVNPASIIISGNFGTAYYLVKPVAASK